MTSARIDRTNVAALIPAFREERSIADVVRRTRLQLDLVMVVDDGSGDATTVQAASAGAEVQTHEINRGKGAAIKTGLRELSAKGVEYVMILDGDGQHLPEEIQHFLSEANLSHAPFIVGSRMADIAAMPFVRRQTNRFMSWRISRACGQWIPDTQCGFRMIHRDVIPHLFCESNNYDYETEMLLIAARAGFQIAAVPVSTVYGDEESKIHPVRDTIKFFKLMARYRRMPLT
ncbi:MAG: hypothetical protein QOD99_2799 [Chthoniobacter sp.]|jgi:glycosyltransferase involved in cell wall biosynthesis|nr:hypothetical protein [Chthoniobacter sp.]